jgi:hypothetical protein
MTEGVSPSPWWSIPQAFVWIVTRSESTVLRAAGLPTAASLRRMTGISSRSVPEEPPVALAAAPDELVRAWQARRIALYGRQRGERPARSIPGRGGLCLRDHRGEICLGDRTLYFDTRAFWSSLSVRADDCRRCWPTPINQAARPSRSLTAAHHSSEDGVLALIEEKRKALRAERKRAGRDVLLRAAMDHFGLSRKVALDIWNKAPRDRKGGRPKKTRIRDRRSDRQTREE